MFKITLDKNLDYDIPILRLEGSLDIRVSSMFERNLSKVLLKNPEKITLDFRNIIFMDSYIVDLLREYYKFTVFNGGQMEFINLSKYNKNKLNLIDVGKTFYIN